jgi:glucokinase
MMRSVGIDIGGTLIKAGVVGEDGEILVRAEIGTDVAGGIDAIESSVRQVVDGLGDIEDARNIGIGSPGAIDRERGLVRQSPNIPCWSDYPAAERLSGLLGRNVAIDNDANCAALAEGRYGAARDVASFLLVTLGTGVGGGVVLGGRVWHGDSGRGGEVGHVVVDPRGRECGCGGRGCLETVSSATAILATASRQGLTGDVQSLAVRARLGGGAERALFDQAGRGLGIAVTAWLNILDVHTIVIGGGVSAALDLIEPALRREIASRVYALDPGAIRILHASLGPDAGFVGASLLEPPP